MQRVSSTRRAIGALLCGLTITFTAGCSSWWMYQGNAEHTGFNPGLNSKKRTLYWTASPVGPNVALTAPAFGLKDTGWSAIYLGSSDGHLFAFARDGTLLWTFTAPSGNGFAYAPVAALGHVYAATAGATPEVISLEQETGAVVWRTPLPPLSGTSPAVSAGANAAVGFDAGAGVVFVNTNQYVLHALDAATGVFRWSVNTSPVWSNAQLSSPAFALGKVFVASDDALFAYDASTGAQLWRFMLPGPERRATPVLRIGAGAPDLVYIGDTIKLYAVNAQTGLQVWSHPVAMTQPIQTVALAHGKVFVIGLFDAVTALDAQTGALAWTWGTGPASGFALLVTPPAIGGQILYAASQDQVFGIDATTGTLAWKDAIPGLPVGINSYGSGLGIGFELLVIPSNGVIYTYY